MKYFLILFLTTSLLVACDDATTTTQRSQEEEETMTAKENDTPESVPVAEMTYEQLGKALLIAVANGENADDIQQRLRAADADQLSEELSTDAKRKAFWINIYNAYVNILLSENPDLWEDRDAFFGEDRFNIAGEELSLDKVEHGIIRSSSIKLSAGYLGKPFTDGYERKMRTELVDPRIHFAVNCGAKDCPPVHLLDSETIESELETMTKNYLQKWTTYDAEADTVATTSLMSWFRGDFKGKDGVVKFLKVYDALPEDAGEPELKFKPYDWSMKIGVFANEVKNATVSL